LTSAQVKKDAFGVYVHWPFCLSKCPYCDFNSHVRHAPIDEERFARAFAREIETTAARSPGREVSSIFLGGGTPSLMRPQTVGAILDAIGRHWRVAPDAEVTLEANPTSVEATRFAGYRAAGINRVSLGVQALDDASLKALGRLHTAREALDAVRIARAAFERYSFDLIYARPDQTPDMWADELKLAISEAAEHLSLYQLTIEEGTPFFGPARRRQIEDAGRSGRARALRRHAGGLQRAGIAGLRDFQSRPLGRRVPA
jgi:putative oxygen-independent coproporphyrinogen III oxidase